MTTSIQQGMLVPVDVALGVAAPVWRLAAGTTRVAARVAAPWLRLSLRPPGVRVHLQPGHWLAELALAGADRRQELGSGAGHRLDVVVPATATVVLDRIDLTEVVVERVDLETVVTTVLDRLDLTEIVLQRVDLQAVVATVLAQTDLVAIAEEVLDAVDLPEIIRESSGSMASDTVRGARMQGISADEAVGRAVDRLLLRHSRRGAPVPDLPPVTVSEAAPRSPAPERTP